MTRPIRTALAAAGFVAMAGCNTVAGIGEDLGALGDAMTGSSERAQRETSSGKKIEDDGSLLGGPPKPGSQKP